jgi:hypothetical protein
MLLDLLYRGEVGSVADVSEVRSVSIFRVEVSRVSECVCTYTFGLIDPRGKGGGWRLFPANRDSEFHPVILKGALGNPFQSTISTNPDRAAISPVFFLWARWAKTYIYTNIHTY